MAKIRAVESDGKRIGYCFFCPACGHGHKFCTEDAHEESGPIWTLTGMPDRPTVRASVRVEYGGVDGWAPKICHSLITDGNIWFYPDSTHSLANATVSLPDF